MEIIADTSAVPERLLDRLKGISETGIRCRVVVPEYFECRVRHTADGHMGEQRQQIPRSATRILANKPRWVSPGRATVKYEFHANLTRPQKTHLKYRNEIARHL